MELPHLIACRSQQRTVCIESRGPDRGAEGVPKHIFPEAVSQSSGLGENRCHRWFWMRQNRFRRFGADLALPSDSGLICPTPLWSTPMRIDVVADQATMRATSKGGV